MSPVDDRPADDTARQLAEYFVWLEAELGPIATPAPEPTVSAVPERSSRTWWPRSWSPWHRSSRST